MKVRPALFLILIVLISLAQACITQSELNNPLKTQENSPDQAPTNTVTALFLTRTPKFSPTHTYAALENIDIAPKGNWGITELKSTSIATSLEPLGATKASEVADDDCTEFIPTATVPRTINYPEPTATQRPPEPTVTERPPDPTAFAGCPNGCTTHPAGCDIKGNISFTTGEKIYHVPDGEYYDATIINPDYGERWFCTEQEAIDNGWRKSKY